MRKNLWRQILSGCILFLFLFLLPVEVKAAEATLLGLKFSDASISGTTATMSASKPRYSSSAGEKTVTITNNTDNTILLSFNYEKKTAGGSGDKGSATVSAPTNGTVMSDDGSKCTMTLKSKGYFTVKVVSDDDYGYVGSSTYYYIMSNISVTTLYDSTNLTVNYDSTLGTVTHDGSVVSAGTTISGIAMDETLTASAKSGSKFLGWIATDGEILSRDAAYAVKPSSSAMTVTAVFANTSPWFFVSDSCYLVEGWDKAMAYGGTVILANNATLPAGTYTIPSGVTLVVPFDSVGTVITNNMGNYLLESNDTKSMHRKLTMSSGANLIVKGSLNIGSKTYKQMSGQAGPYGAIEMESGSNITIGSGATMYAWGYVIAGTSGSGTVTVESGGTVYENLAVMDYPGKASTTNDIYSKGRFPLRTYTVRNVEVPMTFQSGAKEEVFYSLWGGNVGYSNGFTKFIGDANTYAFQIGSGGTMEKSYANKKQILNLNGSITLNSLSVQVKLSIISSGITVTTSKTSGIPLPSGFDIAIQSGTVTLNENVILTEGTRLTVASGATANLNGKNVYILDADDDAGSVSAKDRVGNQYAPVTTDAVLDVNGILTANGGFYTSENGACVISSQGTGKIQITGSSTSTTLALKTGSSTASTVKITKAKLLNGDNKTYVETDKCTAIPNTYTYNKDKKAWVCEKHTIVTDAAVNPTCTETGLTEGKHCTVCNDVDVLVAQEVIPATGHTEVPVEGKGATCTETGLTAGVQCKVCGEFTTPQTEIPALGHTAATEPVVENVVEATCVAGGSYDNVIYCTVESCKAEISRTPVTTNALGHSYDEGKVTTAPTCEIAGEKTYTCTRCTEGTDGHTKTEVVVALGHEWDNDCDTTCNRDETHTRETEHKYESVVTAPTCTADGYTTYTCTACGDNYVADQVDALGHTESEAVKENEVNATCRAEGSYDSVVYCSVCGAEISRTKVTVDKLPHTEVVDAAVEPDCENTGLTEGKHCGVCNEVFIAQNVVAATGHTVEIVAGKDASCTETGLTEGKKCSVCNKVIVEQETVDALGHKYDAVVTAPTCTEAGYTTYTCSVCGDTYTGDNVAAKGHTVVVDKAVAPTCTETGLAEGSHCSVCGEVIVAQTVVDALGHKHEAVVTAPTCTTGGFTTYTCHCGDTYTADEVAALGHSYETVVTAPTCTEAGYTTYTCSVCGDTYTGDKVNATGHDYKSVVTAPTCTEKGYTTYTCHCGDSYVADEVAATGHTYTSKVTTDPTCTEEGVETFTCACGDSYTEAVDALGHDEVAHEAKAPTCTEIGYDAYVTCSRCDYTTYVEKAALGHDEVAHDAKAPTCTEIGWDAYETCSRCDYTTYAEKAALGHDEVAHEAKAPTCTEIGWDAYETCSRCDYTTRGADIPATGHSYTSEVTKQPTCTEEGVKTYSCECGATKTEVIPATGHVHNITYGDGYVLVDGDDLAQLVPTTFIQKVGVEELMRKIDFCAAYAGERLSDDITGTHFWDFVGRLFNGEGAGLSNDELANAMVLYVADYADGVDKQTIVDLLRENTSLTTDMNNENFQQDLTYAALIYGMYVSYAYDSGDAALIEKTETVSEVMSDRTNADFIAYIEQDNVNFEGFKAALRIVSASTDSVEAVRKLLSEGFNSDDLKTLINTEITENVTYTRVENTETHKITTKCAVCETTLSETTTADCVDSDDDNLCDKCGEAVEPEGYSIGFVNYTGSGTNRATITVDEKAVNYVKGSRVVDTIGSDGKFVVSCAKACAVILATENDIGETDYVRLPAYEVANGYQFTIPELSDELTIIVALKGDANLSGNLNAIDVNSITRYRLTDPEKHLDLTKLQIMIARVREATAETLNARDATYVQRSMLTDPNKKYVINW